VAAEDEGKTEDASAHKLQKAREEGQVAKSQDFSAAVILLGGTIMIYLLAGWMREYVGSCMYRFMFIELADRTAPEGKEIIPYLLLALTYLFFLVAPFLLFMLFIAIAVNVWQVGFTIATETLKLKFDKLNPVSGLKRLFSMQNFVMLGKNLLKVVFIFAIAFPALSAAYAESGLLTYLAPAAATEYCINGAFEVALRAGLGLLILALFDLWYQRHIFADKMKMKKEEVKDEMRSMEGDPQIKSKRRQKQLEMSRQAREKMMKEIPDADVVVRNPTHYAVALKYDLDKELPIVVAKGQNKIAEKILELARQARVPLWQDPWLARELYKLDIGAMIAPELAVAVAGVLANVVSAEKRAEFLRREQEKQSA
jgi:flagellar biosynthetic protein FlhB